MILAWTATIFRQFFDYFLSICLGESANRPESIFSLFFGHPLEPPGKAFFQYFLTILWSRPENHVFAIFGLWLP